MAVQADGRIVVVGSRIDTGGNSDFAIARYNVDGSPDSSFDGDGQLITAIGEFNDWVKP